LRRSGAARLRGPLPSVRFTQRAQRNAESQRTAFEESDPLNRGGRRADAQRSLRRSLKDPSMESWIERSSTLVRTARTGTRFRLSFVLCALCVKRKRRREVARQTAPERRSVPRPSIQLTNSPTHQLT